ncbi:hypothetical protein DSLASN_01250 [Desulfoluna limicola]|uniref:Major tropism determinant second domain-containing protein n=1 Tax=Desulfoluna limicola TaxID=2810562 RepID=A0ABM7PBC3_9BACT|nr:hypothetical protein [Desulfoluna limicola]BCS94493.1 hypothetical protein DSLASN_01250 [Desulfoluna limicola]
MSAGDKFIIPSMGAGTAVLMGQLSKGTGNTLNLPDGMVNIGGHGKGYLLNAQTNWDPLTAGNNDGSFSAFTLGDDIYLYATQDPTGIAKIVASRNATYPDSKTAESTRKIGGFHYGRVRGASDYGVPVDGGGTPYGTGWEANVVEGIVPNSAWDLTNRPKCDPSGMVKVGSMWVDIYPTSAAEPVAVFNQKLAAGKAQSAYGVTPLTGTEGLNWYTFTELARRSDKRMLSYEEWCAVAEGSPQGNAADNINAWTKIENTGRTMTGAVYRAISVNNVVECVGNVWEWTNCQVVRSDNDVNWAYRDIMPGAEVGQIYMLSDTQFVNVLAGGHWARGELAGSRCAALDHNAWNVAAYIGVRFACDNL